MKSLNVRFMALAVLLASGLIFTGCEETEDKYTESQDEHICEHLEYGPVATLDASTSIADAMSALSSDSNFRVQALLHTRFDVIFPMDTNNTYSGYVPYLPIGGDGDYILYLNQAVDVRVINHSEADAMVEAESSSDHSEDCEAVRFRGMYHLHDTDEYVLYVSGAEMETIGMIFVPSTEEDEEHDH
jgi:hypothetical protein